MTASAPIKQYLKGYGNCGKEEEEKKKRSKSDAMGVLVVDEDPVWQKPVKFEEEENDDDSADEEKPQIEEDIETKRMKRLEQLRSRRPYHAISEDGSGWVSIFDAPKPSNSNIQDFDMSPPRQRRARFDTPSPEPELKPSGFSDEVPSLSPLRLQRSKAMNAFISERVPDPVYRDKQTGKRISKEEFLKSRKGEKPKEKKLEWGKGLVQKREAEARQHELELEKEKPFARTRDDPELDNMLKERVRWGDPMALLVKRKHSEPVLEDLGDGEKMKESGFIIPQDIPSHSWIKRRLDAAPNRFGIRPGRHWDGVDRSNVVHLL
ncbi:hypothetical protein HHK36_006575 [Tetracentron sinense]|uniref:BUD13 homolog n=1 Tax=Tetracentron sinense TaxID=13715 RepID=A0A834ZJ90_TETSI|nr:hypothetical protein HHK36_006575 [Tetracentron sinense]